MHFKIVQLVPNQANRLMNAGMKHQINQKFRKAHLLTRILIKVIEKYPCIIFFVLL